MIEKLKEIKKNISNTAYRNEIDIIDGIIKPLLFKLGWDVFDTVKTFLPEYELGKKRVDIALCKNRTPFIFIEAKRIDGIGPEAEEQLLDYAFREGVPIAILTDGREWHFYLPSAQGTFSQRKFYKLDLIEREVADIKDTLERYLQHQSVINGDAKKNAQDDHQSNQKNQAIADELPKAWQKLVGEKDEMLIGLLSEKVSDLCGHNPGNNIIIEFLQKLMPATKSIAKSIPVPKPQALPSAKSKNISNQIGFNFQGKFYAAKNNTDIMLQLFQTVFANDLELICNANKPINGKARNFIANSIANLYKEKDKFSGIYTPKSKEFIKGKHKVIREGWYLGTNYPLSAYKSKFSKICELINIAPNKDLIVFWKE